MGTTNWVADQLSKAYEIQREIEGKILNRIVRWAPRGNEMEADPRYAELVLQQLV